MGMSEMGDLPQNSHLMPFDVICDHAIIHDK
jgi:hypothetical protein